MSRLPDNRAAHRPHFRIVPLLFGTILSFCLSSGPAYAQLSPGDLSAPHAHLEGLRKCGSCHKLGDRDVIPKCLECHAILAERREAGRGLHAHDDYAVCTDCHMEHRGRDADILFWPDGRDGFAHADAGYELEGRHRHLECRACHKGALVRDPAPLLAASKDLDRTWMGLGTACTDCHDDVHRNQLSTTCTSCHDQNAWKPVPMFDHATTAFPLTGRHRDTACAKCHEPLDPDTPVPGASRWKGLAHAACTDCHRDPHAGRLGPRCTDCHDTTGWLTGRAADFDHDRTRYPLRGRHATVACAKCHSREGTRPAFAACTDCHDDAHGAAATARPRLARCEDCHDVQGFRPARFPLARHDATPFPLTGAHRAMPCDACHRPAPDGRYELVLDHAACTDCHRDPHGPVATAAVRRCDACHTTGTWRTATYDHADVWPLEGAHARTTCTGCHAPVAEADRAPAFAGAPTHCVGCHADIHLGQFTVPDEPAVRCDRCHDTVDWFAQRFDHDRHSRFPLRGGHEGVACDRCHAPLQGDGARSLTFKPLETECAACHRTTPSPSGGDR